MTTADLLVRQCKYHLYIAEAMLEGLLDEHSALEPIPGNKTPGWLLGHLCITGDFARRLCGRKAIAPAEWRATFRPGTKGALAPSEYPPMSELTRNFREIYIDLCDAMLNVDESALAVENPFEPARRAFPTVGEFVPYIMTGHLAYHVAQLGDWRRAAGLGHKGHI